MGLHFTENVDKCTAQYDNCVAWVITAPLAIYNI